MRSTRYPKIKYPVLIYNHGSQVHSPENHPFVFWAGSFMKVGSNSWRGFKSLELTGGSLILIFGFPQLPGTTSKSKFTFVSHT